LANRRTRASITGRLAFLVATLFAISCIAFASVSHWKHKAAPRAVYTGNQFDLGNLVPARIYIHNFVVKNAGDAPLHILGTKTSCLCTVAALKGAVVSPGGAQEINVRLTASKYPGRTRQAIVVQTDDARHPTMILIIFGRVVAPATEPANRN
jgi:hypothetical protein